MDYRFVDCRWSLTDPGEGRTAYRAGHIPGAVFVDVDTELASVPGAGGRHPLPDAGAFAETMSNAGIGEDTFVVAYGSLGGGERLWWLLRHFGHGGCAVIDLDGWRGPLVTGEERATPARFVPDERADDTISLEELEAGREALVVVDSRVAARWRGEANQFDRVPGRIPGAVSAPWNEPLPELPPGDLVAYCGSGVTACVTLHRLHLAGREGRLYPGSWSEREQYPDLPVERST